MILLLHLRSTEVAKLLQSCPTLCKPMDCSPPGSSVCGILQARRLEWAAMPSSRGSSRQRLLSVQLANGLAWRLQASAYWAPWWRQQKRRLGPTDRPRNRLHVASAASGAQGFQNVPWAEGETCMGPETSNPSQCIPSLEVATVPQGLCHCSGG